MPLNISDPVRFLLSFSAGENVLHCREADTMQKIYHSLKIQYQRQFPRYSLKGFSRSSSADGFVVIASQ